MTASVPPWMSPDVVLGHTRADLGLLSSRPSVLRILTIVQQESTYSWLRSLSTLQQGEALSWLLHRGQAEMIAAGSIYKVCATFTLG